MNQMDTANCHSLPTRCQNDNHSIAVATSVFYAKDKSLLLANTGCFMHPTELSYLARISNEDRAGEFLMGRFAAKHALNSVMAARGFQEICIERGVFSQPVVLVPNEPGLDISISHKKDIAIALAHPTAYPMGIDIETIKDTRHQVLESQMTTTEISELKLGNHPYSLSLSQLWVIKEALSKVLKTGLTTPFQLFETCDRSLHHGGELRCFFTNFYQYRARCWLVNEFIVAVVYPRNLDFDMEPENFFNTISSRENTLSGDLL